jgi:glycosyltransferase involved in cell wall biosynthesis
VFNPCIVIPFYNHIDSIASLVTKLRPLQMRCYLVNDASDQSCERLLDCLARDEAPWLRLISYRPNQGKGEAVMTGILAAAHDGYTHAVQIDADEQHKVSDLGVLLQHAAANEDAVIAGYAVYDGSVPGSRRYGRYITHFWVWVNTLSTAIRDSMCGLRVYPLATTLQVWRTADRCWLSRIGRRMSFDIEILVHLFWRGVSVINVPVAVTYPSDGVSHFRLWRDNVGISLAHTRLFFGMLWRAPKLLSRRWQRNSA